MDPAQWLSSAITEYFVNPLAYPDKYPPYNPVNTAAFALAALAAAYLIYRGLGRLGIAIDQRFYRAIVPFILLGSAMRVVTDAGALPRAIVVGGTTLYPFVTPGIYILIFALAAASMAVAFVLGKVAKMDFSKTVSSLGWLFAATALLRLLPLFRNFYYFLFIIAIASAGLLAYHAFCIFTSRKRGLMHRLAVFGQCLDGGATFVGVSLLGYSEQHVVANYVFGVGTPLLFLILKIIFAFIVVEAIESELSQKEGQRAFVLLLITIFGLAPGMRDALRILAGV
ncbi:DUF63 family protein [Candidatus Micrarchaeota archaeon]|nr:DUF63 family protein [Candidatus Micrarchaeota archaeon]